MLKNILKRMFGKKPPPPKAARKGNVVSVDRDELGPEADAELKEFAVERSGLTFFEGRIEHGYSLDVVTTNEKCPRCGAQTQQHYAEWIYATQIAPRAMIAPAGYFCRRCPTVIVDEGMIQSGIKRQFRYQGVLGLDYEQRNEPDLFRTWNGQTAVHIIDERGVPQGLTTTNATPRSRRSGPPPKRSTKKSKKRKRRRK